MGHSTIIKIIMHFQSVKINLDRHLFLPLCQNFIDKQNVKFAIKIRT